MKHFELLSLEEQKKAIFGSKVDQKAELILQSREPEAIIQDIPYDELFFIYKGCDPETRLDIINCLTTQQSLFLSDIECWQKDLFTPEKFLEWLSALLEADMKSFSNWLLNADIELLVLGFRKYVDIVKYLSMEDPVEAILPPYQPYFTIDGFYYVSVKEEISFDLFKKALEIIYSENKDIYLNLMEGLINEDENEIMENAYGYREDRLSEHGFPEKETALRIYKRLSTEEFYRRERKEIEFLKEDYGDYGNKSLVVLAMGSMFFDEVLSSLKRQPKEVIDHIQMELAWLINKIIICRGFDNLNEETLQQNMAQLRSYLNIGLESLSKKNNSEAVRLMKEYWLEDIFRIGFSKLITVREEAEKVTKYYNAIVRNREHVLDDFYRFIGHHYEDVFRGILKRHPHCWDKREQKYRYFQSSEELNHTFCIIEEVKIMFSVLEREEFCSFKEFIAPRDMDIIQTDITLAALMLTMFVNFTLYSVLEIKPLSFKEFLKFIDKVFCDNRIKTELVEKFINKISAEDVRFTHFFKNIIDTNTKEIFALKEKSKEECISSSHLMIFGERL